MTISLKQVNVITGQHIWTTYNHKSKTYKRYTKNQKERNTNTIKKSQPEENKRTENNYKSKQKTTIKMLVNTYL